MTSVSSIVLNLIYFNSRVHFYQKKRVRRTLTVEQYLTVLDSRIILGINGLWYATNVLPLYVGCLHIFLYPVPHHIERASYLSVVVNSSLKFFVYLLLSHDFRWAINGEMFFPDEASILNAAADIAVAEAEAPVVAAAQAAATVAQAVAIVAQVAVDTAAALLKLI